MVPSLGISLETIISFTKCQNTWGYTLGIVAPQTGLNIVSSLGISLETIISFTVKSASAILVTESTPSTRRAILEDPDDDEEKDALLHAYLAPEKCPPSDTVQNRAILEVNQLSREGEGIRYLIMKFRINCKAQTSPIPFAITFQKYWLKMSMQLVQLLPHCPPGDQADIEHRQKVTFLETSLLHNFHTVSFHLMELHSSACDSRAGQSKECDSRVVGSISLEQQTTESVRGSRTTRSAAVEARKKMTLTEEVSGDKIIYYKYTMKGSHIKIRTSKAQYMFLSIKQ